MLKHIKKITEALAVALAMSMIAAIGMHVLTLILRALPRPTSWVLEGWMGDLVFFGFLTVGSFLGFAVVMVIMAYTKVGQP